MKVYACKWINKDYTWKIEKYLFIPAETTSIIVDSHSSKNQRNITQIDEVLVKSSRRTYAD